MTLRTFVFLTVTLLGIGTAAQAQVFVQNNTAPPSNARFEVLMVTGAVYRTHVKLDRYTGEVWSLSYKDGRSLWISAPVEDPPTQTGNAPRFQIFAALMENSTVLLLDSQLGKTWTLALWKMEAGSPRWQWKAEAPPVKLAVTPPAVP